MGLSNVSGAVLFVLAGMSVSSALSAEFVTPVYRGDIRPITEPFMIEVMPGWQAQCIARADGSDIAITKTTTDEGGIVLKAQVSNSPRSISAVDVYGVQLFFSSDGSANDVQIDEITGHPIDDENYIALRNAATSVVPEAEFAGRMSDAFNVEENGPSKAQPAVDVTLRVVAEGTTMVNGEDHLFIRRTGSMSGLMEGQHVIIRFAGYTRVHRASGLIAEEVLNTELSTDSASPRRENTHLSCDIARSGSG
jgi:hypothetical protein